MKYEAPEFVSPEFNGVPTFAYAVSDKDNIETMIACTKAEIHACQKSHYLQAPAPFYFLRVAILARKQKNYALEVSICTVFLDHIEKWLAAIAKKGYRPGRDIADASAGPSAEKIRSRLPKARALLESTKAQKP